MSIQYSNLTTKDGLLQQLEKHCLLGDTGITSNPLLKAQFTADINLALVKLTLIGIKASGTWQVDDSNHTKYPIIKTALVSGQRDYSFTTDEQSNLILDIYSVYIRISATGVYQKIRPVDVQQDEKLETDSFTNGLDITGIPYRYDKTANGIFLDPVPSYNSTDGLKIYINREPSYFTIADTIKVAGLPGILHEYLFIEPAWRYAGINGLSNFNWLEEQKIYWEKEAEKYFSRRARDERGIMTMKRVKHR